MSWCDGIFALLAVVAAGLGAMPILLAFRFRRYVTRELARPLSGYTPKVSVILPCKGLDPGFDENIQAIFDQDYPDFELIFATATADDEACPAIRRLIDRNLRVPARLIHAGLPTTCSQQNNNQLAGVAAARPDSEVFVIMDSDIRPRPEYLRNLVDPLHDTAVGAATGYRWYLPVTGGFGSWLRSTWNMGALPILADSKRNFAWGGSMAFRRRDFPHDVLVGLWGNALSDDHTLTARVRELGLGIHYVPKCLAISHEDSTLAETLEWTTRQTIVTRVYDRPFWWTILGVHTTSVLFTILAIVGCIVSCVSPWEGGAFSRIWPLFLMPVIGQGAALGVIWPGVMTILPREVADHLAGKKGVYVCLAQPASLLALWNSVASLCTNRIAWRGTVYEMRSPTETVVLASDR